MPPAAATDRLQVLASLAGDSDENMASIAKANGIKPLIALLDSPDEKTQEYAAHVLADMARRQEDHAAKIAQDGGISLCVKLLAKGSLQAKTQAGDLLRSIAIRSTAEVEEAGAVTHLIELLSSDSLDAQAGSFPIFNTHRPPSSSLAASPPHPILACAPHPPFASLDTQELAAHALTGIAAGGCKEKIREAGGIELLVRVLQAKSAAESADGSPQRRGIREAAAGEAASRDDAQIERVKAHAANALSELARDDADIQRQVKQCDGIDALVDVVNRR